MGPVHAKAGQPPRKTIALDQNEYVEIEQLEAGDQKGLGKPSEVLVSGLPPVDTS